ncbi:MAG: hypothetical protein HY904_01310 [Deltaproteobacteria bacterium]|nr:hypothetical protein [Deltaproteobacteria bacterium]
MAKDEAFNDNVTRLTRVAEQILDDPELLEGYLDVGGLKEDLENIKGHGVDAAAANQGHSQKRGDGKGATTEALMAFLQLQKDYADVMSIVQAVHGDLKEAGASQSMLARVQAILEDETQTTLTNQGNDGKRSARKVRAHDTIRAEIEKDGKALLAFTEIHERLLKRRVPLERMKKLASDAEDLDGKLGVRLIKKGAAKTATAEEREAVAKQKGSPDNWVRHVVAP